MSGMVQTLLICFLIFTLPIEPAFSQRSYPDDGYLVARTKKKKRSRKKKKRSKKVRNVIYDTQGIRPLIGIASVGAGINPIMLGIDYVMPMGWLIDSLAGLPMTMDCGVAYWSYSVGGVGGGSLITVDGGAGYHMAFAKKWTIEGSARFGVAQYSVTTEPGFTATTASSTLILMTLGGGINFKLSKKSILGVEFRMPLILSGSDGSYSYMLGSYRFKF